MFVVLIYDINQKRVGKALKVCRKYLQHVQRSAFEGQITEANLKKLKYELAKIINPETDSVCIYKTEYLYSVTKEQIGLIIDTSNIFI